jgi:hypothetical protein
MQTHQFRIPQVAKTVRTVVTVTGHRRQSLADLDHSLASGMVQHRNWLEAKSEILEETAMPFQGETAGRGSAAYPLYADQAKI